MSNLSLMAIMRDDVDFGKRITKKAEEIKANKESMLEYADNYGKKYQEEIIQGTEFRAKLLTEGASRGLSEDEIMAQHGKFVPTVYTPILNLLFFMLRENEPKDALRYKRRDAINEALVKAGQLNHDTGEQDLSKDELLALLDESIKKMHTETTVDPSRQKVNEQFNAEERQKVELKSPEDMETYLFGHLTLDQFNTLKKLKSLTQSSNIDEASLAFKKGKELSVKYKVDWDKIPCYYKKG